MIKNVAGQVVTIQLTSRTDGSPVVAGTTNVFVTGDNGTQTAGGTATHKGNGLWAFTPSQAQTNFDQIAFTFVNASAINASHHLYTTFPQSADINVDTRLDNLDAAISSRSTQASVDSIPTNPLLDDDSRLDNIDATISSRSTQTSVDAVGLAVTGVGLGVAAIPTNPLLATDPRLDALGLAVAAIPTNPLLTNDARLDNLDAPISGVTAPTAADIYTYFTSLGREAIFQADVSALALQTTLTAVQSAIGALNDISAADVTAAVPTANQIAVAVEAAIIDEGDGQQVIDAILQVFNANLDLPALELQAIASQVRTELSVELARIDAAITSRANATDQTAVKAKTDQLQFTGSDVQAIASNMRGTDGASTVDPDNAGIAAVKAQTDQLVFVGSDVQATSTNMRGTDGANTIAPDNVGIAAVRAKTDQLNFTGSDVQSVASNMRGTDNANTVTPPTPTEIDTELTAAHGTGSWQQASGGGSDVNVISVGGNAVTSADDFKADVSGLSTLTAAQVWANASRTLTDKSGFELTAVERQAIATAVEAAILNEGDGQAVIDAIVQAIGNSNVDEVALVAAIRADLERANGDLDTIRANQQIINDGIKDASLLVPHTDDTN